MKKFAYGEKIVLQLKNFDIYYSTFVKYIEEEEAVVVKDVTDLQGVLKEGLNIFKKDDLLQVNKSYASDDENDSMLNAYDNIIPVVVQEPPAEEEAAPKEKLPVGELITMEMNTGQVFCGSLLQKSDLTIELTDVLDSEGNFVSEMLSFDCCDVRKVYCWENQHEMSCQSIEVKSEIDSLRVLPDSSSSRLDNVTSTENLDSPNVNQNGSEQDLNGENAVPPRPELGESSGTQRKVLKKKKKKKGEAECGDLLYEQRLMERNLREFPNGSETGDYLYGQRLAVELESKHMVYGDFVRKHDNRIDLKNIIDENGCFIAGIKVFFDTEVRQVYSFYETQDPKMLPFIHESDNENEIKLTLLEYERLLQLTRNYVYIQQKDVLFYRACEDLTEQEFIGVVGIGANRGRDGKFALLVISTIEKIYIFECIGVMEMPEEIKFIFESDEIKKVIFDGRRFLDCVFNAYRTNLVNIFDIQLAEMSCFLGNQRDYSGHWRNVSQCLRYNLNFPSLLLYNAVYTDKKLWYERPLTHEFKLRAAQLAAYLILLKDFFETSVLMKGHYVNVDKYYEAMKPLLSDDDVDSEMYNTITPETVPEWYSDTEGTELLTLGPDLAEMLQESVNISGKKGKQKASGTSKKKPPKK